ncbi:MBL fold metallo-hydrolase [Hylemonella gracilis]|uniref:Metallo-hydrolase/oxidoreductase n=1 Tax=Hylemonella gracilis ATCC 19624 TaxID=887062 RepID=F3KRY6_9BURK|nr:MBL fold metallo-hydrolase [Hylemonella gracilis]EGI77470.1 metallo-hydrolase/oxidoreductase [Hylemonella gracilis ATCC 19624]
MAKNPYYDPAKPHHRPQGFQNVDREFPGKSLAEVLRWKIEASRKSLPAPPSAPIPVVAPDLDFLHRNARAGAAMQPAMTWIGHATVMVQMSGLTLLTDAIFSERASPLSFVGPKRHQPPGVALSDLPRIDLVLTSHNHYDHLDVASVQALNRQTGGAPLFVTPLGLKPWLVARGVAPDQAVELDWWDSHPVQAPGGMVDVVLAPAQHWSARGLGDRMATLWGGFAVFGPDFHLFFAGDTAYSREFTALRERYAERQSASAGGSFDLALLPIGAYEPRWFMRDQHVNPEEAVKIHRDLAAKRSLGMHWGTFALTDEALDEPPRALAQVLREQAIDAQEFFVMAIGETRLLPPRRRLGS